VKESKCGKAKSSILCAIYEHEQFYKVKSSDSSKKYEEIGIHLIRIRTQRLTDKHTHGKWLRCMHQMINISIDSIARLTARMRFSDNSYNLYRAISCITQKSINWVWHYLINESKKLYFENRLQTGIFENRLQTSIFENRQTNGYLIFENRLQMDN